MRSADIKNLCIALEALSRFPNTELLSDRVRDLLDDTLKEEEQRITENKQHKPTRTSLDDDEIPF